MQEDIYNPKIKALLEQVRTEALERGYECLGPYDMSDDCIRWNVLVRPKGADSEDGVDISITIPESEHYDGSEEGVNFSSDIVHYEGIILGGLCPYNYTDQCWVDKTDEDAVASRWDTFTRLFDASAALDVVEEFYQGKGMASAS